MKRKAWPLMAVGLFLSALGVRGLAAQKEKGGEQTEVPSDKGPDAIDVLKYPTEQQDNYKVFAKKCSRCHNLARTINWPYTLPEEWKDCVARMQQKKRSGIDAKSARKIVEFLNYDSSVRKTGAKEK